MNVQLPPFQQVFERHRDEVYRFVLAMVGCNHADDVFQETFLAALRAYPALNDSTSLRAWIFTIARNKAIDEYRSGARRAIPAGELPDITGVGELATPEPELWQDVRGLPPKQRAAVVHRYVHDLAYDEIGALLDCSAAAARRSVAGGDRAGGT